MSIIYLNSVSKLVRTFDFMSFENIQQAAFSKEIVLHGLPFLVWSTGSVFVVQ